MFDDCICYRSAIKLNYNFMIYDENHKFISLITTHDGKLFQVGKTSSIRENGLEVKYHTIEVFEKFETMIFAKRDYAPEQMIVVIVKKV